MVPMTADEITRACTEDITKACGDLAAGKQIISPIDESTVVCEGG